MSQLATIAFKRKNKVSKSRAMILIEQLAELHPESVDKLSELYSYFKPATPAKPKQDDQWVCKSVSVNDVRFYLNRLEVLDGWLISTDGHRLHMCKTELENGAYDTQFNVINADDAGRYPDVQRVIPNNRNHTKLADCEIVEYITTLNDKKLKHPQIDIKLDDEVTIRIDSKYWAEAICGFESDAVLSYDDHKNSILIKSDTRKCVIMPISP
jgi:hypothetical protein